MQAPNNTCDRRRRSLLTWKRLAKLDWRCIGLLSVNKDKEKVDDLLSKYSNVFEEGLTTMNTFKAQLQLKEGSTPKFCKARNVPFALRPAVEDELLRLEKEGVIKPVSHSQWASPVVPVPKSDGHIRLCGDYKTTVNPALRPVHMEAAKWIECAFNSVC